MFSNIDIVKNPGVVYKVYRNFMFIPSQLLCCYTPYLTHATWSCALPNTLLSWHARAVTGVTGPVGTRQFVSRLACL